MPRRRCAWWIRWYHERQRNIDLRVLYPALLDHGIELDDPGLALDVWEAYKDEQTHWTCACAKECRP